MSTEHTPAPYSVKTHAVHGTVIATADDDIVAEVIPDNCYPGNAAFIVRACNSYDALVAALRACVLRDDIASDELGDMIRAALAAATE